MAFRKNLTRDAPVPVELWSDDQITAPKLLDVLAQLAHFFDQLGYTETFTALLKEAKKSGLTVDIAEWERGIQAKNAFPLLDLFEVWFDEKGKFPMLPGPDDAEARAAEDSSGSDSSGSDSSDSDSSDSDTSDRDPVEGVLVDVEAEETSDDDSDEEERKDAVTSSDSDSDSESASTAKQGTKRKRVLTPPSSSDGESSSPDDSDSDSDSSSSSEDRDARPVKRTKTAATKLSVSDSNDGSDNSSSSSDSDVSSSSDEDSSSDEKEAASPPPVKVERKTKQEKKDGKQKQSQAKSEVKSEIKGGPKSHSKDTSSQSSATLDGDPSLAKEAKSHMENHVHPDRLERMPETKKEVAAAQKKKQVPFSRIPTDQKVDPRFGSNEYVAYDYADRAHRDLVMTKGKGFTREKNKKKRGSYRGGAIDMTPKGIRFDN